MACLLAHYWASTTSCVWGRSANKNTSSSYCWSVHAHCRRFDRLLGVRMCTHEIWIHTMTTSLLYIPLSSGLLPSPSLFSVLPCHTACIAWAKPSCSCTEMCFLSYLLLCWNVSSCMIMSRHYNNLTCELLRLLAIAQVLIKIARTCNIAYTRIVTTNNRFNATAWTHHDFSHDLYYLDAYSCNRPNHPKQRYEEMSLGTRLLSSFLSATLVANAIYNFLSFMSTVHIFTV